MLGQHVQAQSWGLCVLHAALSRHLGRHSAVNALRSRPGIHIHDTDPARSMASTSQPLHGAGNRARASYLDYQVQFPHIDSQLHG